jgi:hypothetical protein
LYEYAIKPDALRGPAILDLNFELSRYFHSMAIPVRICERRPGYVAHSNDATLAGMSVRLQDDRSNIIEDGFPAGGSIPIPNLGDLPVTIYVFKREIGHGEARKRWMAEKAICFVVNGQMHAFYKSDFFSRQSVDLGYLEKDLLVVVDFTDVPIAKREDLLMPSRDRLREGPDRDAIEKALEDFLCHHTGLRAFNEKRREEELKSVFGDDKPLERVIGKLLKNSPSLANLLGFGQHLKKPTTFDWQKRIGNYRGRTFPIFFRLAPDCSPSKDCPVNASCTFYFETDATNDYFIRSRMPGIFVIAPMEVKKSMRLWNGITELSVKPPQGSVVGTKLGITIQVTDPQRTEPFSQIALELIIGPPRIQKRVQPPTNSTGVIAPQADYSRFRSFKPGDDMSRGLALPKIIPLEKTDSRWSGHFKAENDAVDPLPNGASLDLYVNMSNQSLQSEINTKPEEKYILENQFKYGLALVSLAIYFDFKEGTKENGIDGDSNKKSGDVETRVFSEIRSTTRGVAMVLLPMINNLSAATRSVVKAS